MRSHLCMNENTYVCLSQKWFFFNSLNTQTDHDGHLNELRHKKTDNVTQLQYKIRILIYSSLVSKCSTCSN